MEKRTKLIGLSVIILILVISLIWLLNIDTKENLARTIYKYKTEYVGNNSNVGNIVMNIPFANEYLEYKSIELKTDSEPYMVIIKEQLKEGYTLKDISAKDLRNFVDVMFATIKNLGSVRFEVYYIKDNQVLTATYTLKEDENSKFNYDMSKAAFEEEFNKIYSNNVKENIKGESDALKEEDLVAENSTENLEN